MHASKYMGFLCCPYYSSRCSDLPAELAADGAASARHQHRFPMQKLADLMEIRADLLSSEKILDGDLLQSADGNLAAQ